MLKASIILVSRSAVVFQYGHIKHRMQEIELFMNDAEKSNQAYLPKFVLKVMWGFGKLCVSMLCARFLHMIVPLGDTKYVPFVKISSYCVAQSKMPVCR